MVRRINMYRDSRPELLGVIQAQKQTIIYAAAGVGAGLLLFILIRQWRKKRGK